MEVVYEDLIEELRHELSATGDRAVPVYPFAYDWRCPLNEIETQLGDFVIEVIDRTKLLRHYHENDYAKQPKVNLIGHSMGGLVVAGYLASCGSDLVRQVVTLESPCQGSCEAVSKVVTGRVNLAMDEGRSREREAARATPALYHLLPSFRGAFDVRFDALTDSNRTSIYGPALWQPSVVGSIGKLNDKRELPDGDDAQTVFHGMLERAEAHRTRLDELRLEDIDMAETDWLAIVGVDAETLVGFDVDCATGKPWFRLDSSRRRNWWERENTEERRCTGDGTVPLSGAIPSFMPERRLVCVAPTTSVWN